ncbi:MANSC domain-containing protein 1 isoform X1 [Cololabis saira]|uniref:MANSC domain-containing protein 1 isoform X1 n=2 Tax=Cololabis saira TaxID=129043 RepID=UPI002AD1DE51|nr:MANSC domain-containing protein 1 isoform X1 [Cololabis saira]XP_061570413.1 MANSC domain-containing protein 1 isoform X1 [Cololabis saira]
MEERSHRPIGRPATSNRRLAAAAMTASPASGRHFLKLLVSAVLLAMTSLPAWALEPETCFSRQHQSATVNERELNATATARENRAVRSERDCVLACCSETVGPGPRCKMAVFQKNHSPGGDNCFLFRCPGDDCPLMKAPPGVNAYDIYKGLSHPPTLRSVPMATSTTATSTRATSTRATSTTATSTTATSTTATSTTATSTRATSTTATSTTATSTTATSTTATSTTATSTTATSTTATSTTATTVQPATRPPSPTTTTPTPPPTTAPPPVVIIATAPAATAPPTAVATTTTAAPARKVVKSNKKPNKFAKKGKPSRPPGPAPPARPVTSLPVTAGNRQQTVARTDAPKPPPTTTHAPPTSTPTKPHAPPTTTRTTPTTTTTPAKTTPTTTHAPPTTTPTTTTPTTTSTPAKTTPTTTHAPPTTRTTPASTLIAFPKVALQSDRPLPSSHAPLGSHAPHNASTAGRAATGLAAQGALKSGVVAFMVLGLAVLTLALAVGGRKAMESFDRRHYTRLELNDLHYEI